ncbi:hypothetical protein HZA97_09480 [Candidatus Woesearchaeota archaeon]|nr:hypothetical protein [Candidatus Woesearchaeota archaeon]
MESLRERIKAMENLSEYVGKTITVTYIDQFNKQDSITGNLDEVTPYHNLEITNWESLAGKKYKSTTGIPFVGSPDAITSIADENGKVIYNNENVYPFYNPFFYPNLDKDGILRIGINYKKGVAHTKKVRKLSFGK